MSLSSEASTHKIQIELLHSFISLCHLEAEYFELPVVGRVIRWKPESLNDHMEESILLSPFSPLHRQ